MNDKTLTAVEPYSEPPFLPRYQIAVDIKRRPLGLLCNIRLEILSERFIQKLMCILHSPDRLPWLRFHRGSIRTTRKIVHTDKFVRGAVKHRREFAWQGVMVVLRMFDFNHIHEALEEASCFIGVICAVHPGIIADGNPWRELESLDFSLYCWMMHAEVFNIG
jgi:hypothetical protein